MAIGVHSSRSGSALLITLAFMVMLLGVLLAFFSQTTLQQQVSQSSSSQVSGDVMARGVVESIVGDLLQEISAGSSVTNIVTASGTNSVTNTLYFVSTNNYSNMVPSLSGFTTNVGLENILKVSGTNPFYSVVTSSGTTSNGPIRGSTNSTTNTSYNGRSISTARWNRTLLIARQTPTSTTDYTPVNAFTNAIPKWVLIARNGSNPTNWSNNMIWSPTNSTTVIGRYAYIIHNEGGLLDANVAGYPSSLTNASVKNPAYVPYKSGSYFADLTQIGLNTNQITALVGWRNYASSKTSSNGSTFPSYTIDTNGATNYGAVMMADTNGFLITYQTNSPTVASDRRFTSRQQLIEFLKAADTNAVTNALNALPYLGTFSRSLDQPTYSWDSNRPLIMAPGYSNAMLPPPRDGAPYGFTVWGGNSAYGQDNLVNPTISTNRVGATFTRYDKTTAVVGEPLVKKRFPLSRLAWLTCKGPSASLLTNDPVILQYLSNGVSLQTITNGTASNILSSFGLTWTNGPGTGGIGGYWTYSHGITNTVGTLSAVAALTGANAREPDFFEMLKAGLSAGSLAKGGALSPRYNPWDVAGYGTMDTRLDNHIIQTGANIISQATPDGFPTTIKFDNGTLVYRFWGVNDLPYLQGVVQLHLLVTAASPLPTSQSPVTNQPLTNPGLNATIDVPIIWNPHAAPTTAIPSGLAPTNLRVCLSCYDLAWLSNNSTFQNNVWAGNNKTPQSSYTSNGVATNISGGVTNIVTNPTIPVLNTNATFTNPWQAGTYTPSDGEFLSNPASGAVSNTAMTFNYATNLYREPTPLMRPNIPTGSGLALDSNNVMPSAWSNGIPELNSGQKFIGFYYGQYPNRWIVTPDTNFPSNTVTYTTQNITGGGSYTPTLSIEYQVPGSTSWIPYQQYPIYTEGGGWTIPYDAQPNGSGNTSFALQAANWTTGRWVPSVSLDPRSRRWAYIGGIYGIGNFLDAGQTTLASQRTNAGIGVNAYGANFGELATDGNVTSGSTYYPFTTRMGWSTVYMYYLVNANGYMVDADGVTRLGMGAAYNSTALTTNGMALATPAVPSSRPIILHRPFRNVGELGYVFSDMPWRNLDFATPQSGCSALLDLFCIQENGRPDAVVAGKVDLNTRQAPVLAALIAGGLRDEQPSTSDIPLATNEASALATKLVARTSGTKGPLRNIGDLVGRWISGSGTVTSPDTPYGAPSSTQPTYDGFSADVSSYFTNSSTSLNNRVQRFLGAPIRALAHTGQVGAWNLMIDVVVQTGKYPASAGNIDQFQVQGETRYWVHLAIDRLTGKVLEKTIERVNE